MQYVSLVLGLCFSVTPFLAYRKGLQDGLNINKGKDIKPIQNPIQKAFTGLKERKSKEEMKSIMEGLNNIMTYDGEVRGGES